ncbi:hypothetical protein DPMN_079087 [Dreissena polymorpha]|uniref:Mab-21-like HhH/H2TH-like domain-containing protein n=1 Tax=Dreissena polymorpha TaxID=45954 RepID=A0A9D3YNF7_DREPO|nr:hypothetical protein DPMN_079087 [Dreissena polymorpha]
MHSDIDILHCYKGCTAIHDFADWQCWRMQLLVVTDMSTPPQCCYLQPVPLTNPEFVTEITLPGCHRYAQGRMFLKNTIHEMNFKADYDKWGIDFIRHGPSRSISDDTDEVYAIYCAKLPENCQYIFQRPKPGHWPRPELLTQLKENGVFLVPTNHVENTTNWDPGQHLGILTVRTYDNSHELFWKLSTNFMERLLMFDLTITQIKVKMIRKEFCKPLVGDRLSTFHLKTALLYSVERSPPCIWKDKNFIQCLKLCMTTLRSLLKVRYCPHYTTSNVNLFAGKLRCNEFPVLIEIFTDMIRNDLSCLNNMKMDDLGNRISSNSTNSTSELRYEELDIVVARELLKRLINQSCPYLHVQFLFAPVDTLTCINDHSRFIQNLETNNKTSSGIIHSAVSIKLKMHYSIQAAMKASLCIGQNEILPQEIFILFDKALTSDVTSCRLKLASIYFSLRRFNEAVAILKQVEVLISKKVMSYSPFVTCVFDSELLKRRKEFPDILQNEIALCTIFNRHEINCVPGQLVAEFFRLVKVEYSDLVHPFNLDFWKELAVVDSITYMYYLQYLTFRNTGFISDSQRALKNLHRHVPYVSGHIETSLNLLGHCWELEG